jgi:cytochrome c biogenesis protein CcmG, thiol:disulfide interchange protein DsbE
VLPVAAAWAAAAIAVIGAGLLWLRPLPPERVGTNGTAAPVIGAPGTLFPRTAVQPGARGATEGFTPVPAPAFTLTVLSPGAPPPPVIPPAGGRLALAALRGHPIVVNFWASWCAPCRAEMPMLTRAAHAYASHGVVVLGLDVDDTPADARRFLAQYRVDYPAVIVPDDTLPRAYGVIGLPTTVFVDASGVIRARQTGQFDGADGERTLMRDLDALIGSAR